MVNRLVKRKSTFFKILGPTQSISITLEGWSEVRAVNTSDSEITILLNDASGVGSLSVGGGTKEL